MIVKFRGKKVNVCERLILENAIIFAEGVASQVVDTETGIYLPLQYDTTLTGTFMSVYTDISKGLNDSEVADYVKDIFDNTNEYKKFIKKVNRKIKFDSNQYKDILRHIDKSIEFKKDKLIHNDIKLKNYAIDLLKKQIVNQELENSILEEQKEMNKKFTEKELSMMVNIISSFNENMKNSDYIKAVAETVHKLKDVD